MTLKELEQRYGHAPEVSLNVLRRLSRDRRVGVQRLYRRLKKRTDQRAFERRRLEQMFAHERRLWKLGLHRVAGVDEVGIGPMAGPVVAAAVIFAPDVWIDGVNDSKQLDPDTREALERQIRESALGIGIGVVSSEEVDRLNVYHSGIEAMRRAVEALEPGPDHLLVDARTIPGISPPQSPLTRGDQLSFSVASASIVAKVYRDRKMRELARLYPGYGLEAHKGYCTLEHQQAVQRLGPSPVHRKSYDFIRELRHQFSHRFYEFLRELDLVTSIAALKELETRLKAASQQLSPPERRKLYLVLRRRRNRLKHS